MSHKAKTPAKKMKSHILLALICLSLVATSLLGQTNVPAGSQSANSQEILTQSIAHLQGNPTDTALREKIIKLVLTMNPKPAVPDEVATHEGAAEYAFKNAKTAADFADAAKEYEKALLAAPWLAADYYNCGVAHEKAEEFDSAIRNFNLYLIAVPDAPDATDVRKRVGAVKYQADKAEKDAQAAAQKLADEERQKEAERKKQEAKRNSFEGNWAQSPGHGWNLAMENIIINPYGAVCVWKDNSQHPFSDVVKTGRSISFTVKDYNNAGINNQREVYNLTLSYDGETLSGTCVQNLALAVSPWWYQNGPTTYPAYHRQQ